MTVRARHAAELRQVRESKRYRRAAHVRMRKLVWFARQLPFQIRGLGAAFERLAKSSSLTAEALVKLKLGRTP